jgi:hypothetical protein
MTRRRLLCNIPQGVSFIFRKVCVLVHVAHDTAFSFPRHGDYRPTSPLMTTVCSPNKLRGARVSCTTYKSLDQHRYPPVYATPSIFSKENSCDLSTSLSYDQYLCRFIEQTETIRLFGKYTGDLFIDEE